MELQNISITSHDNTSSDSINNSSSVLSRYNDAYVAARVIVTVGGVVKACGIIIAFVLVIFAFASSKRGIGAGTFIWLIGAVVSWLSFYIWGVIISAQGQLLKASLDSAVNTSPFMNSEEKAHVMSLNISIKSSNDVIEPTS